VRTQAGALLSFLSIGVLIPVLPRYITGALGAGAAWVGIALALPSVTGVLARPLAGRVADHRGRWSATGIGAVSLTLGSLGLVRADSLPLLLGCRAIAGVGEAFTYVGLATAAGDQGRKALNHFSAAVLLGLMVGPPVGEYARSAWGYPAVWLLSAAAAGGLLLTMPVGSFSTLLGARGRTPRPADAQVDRVVSGHRGPLIHRAGLIPGLAYWASVWGYTAISAFLPLSMAKPRGSYLVYGLVLLSVRLGGNTLISSLTPRLIAVLSLALTATGLGGYSAWPSAGMIAVVAVGQALGLPAFLAIGASGQPADQRGSVVATITAFFDMGFLTAALVLGAVVQLSGPRYAFAAASVVAAAGLVLFIPRARRSS
jgi:MFS family permease